MEYFDGVVAAKLFGGGGGGGEPVDVSGKLDKVTTTALVPRVYGVKEDGSQLTYFATPSTDANTIVMRDASKHIAVEDGVAPKQAVNKSQLDKKLDIEGGDITGDLSVAGNVNITGVATHTAEAIFNSGLESDGPVNVNNSLVKITNVTKDIVTQYNADMITLEENGDAKQYNYTFPRSSGALAVTAHSEIINEDTAEQTVDSWKIKDSSSSVSIYYADNGVHTGALVQNGHASLTYSDATNTSSIIVGDGIVSLSYQPTTAGEQATALVISEEGAKINGQKIVVANEITGIPSHINIIAPEGATSGTLEAVQLEILQANLSNFIVFAHKEYHLNADGLVEGYLTYTYGGYENNKHITESITVTVNTRAWVLNRGQLVTTTDYANGSVSGVVNVDEDFSKGLQVSSTGNLGIYRALDTDIASRTTLRPITPLNLNAAVLAALTDANKVAPNDTQKTAFKTAWGITSANGTRVIFAADEPATGDYSEGDVLINTSDECFYCLQNGAWTKQDSFGKPSWHTTVPADTSKILRTEISWTKDIQYKSGSNDTIECTFLCSGDGYARLEADSTGDMLLQGCTNWALSGASNSMDADGSTVMVHGVMFYDTDHNIAKYVVNKFPDGASIVGMHLIPANAIFRYLY